MTKCQRLLLSHNTFTHLTPAISHLTNLKVLTIDHNQLTQLRPDIFQPLTSLQQLNISRNQLTCLPPSIGQLSKLIHLDASHNHLNSLPSLARCTALETLNLSYNNYKTVPGKSLAQLTSLKELDMEGNQIGSAGADECKEVFQLPALQTLKLQGNPLDQATLESVAGYSEFEGRRRKKYGKAIAAGVMMSSVGLTEAADRAVAGRGR
jgi:Leucine-rich repeat (LRR) protein